MVTSKAEATRLGEEQKLAQKQAAQARTLAARAQVAQMEQLRERTPSEVAKGSQQDITIRQDELRNEQQRLVSENVQRIGSSGGAFSSARADALRNMKFDYGSVRSSFYSPPTEFINQKGERVTRPSMSGETPEMRTVTVTRTADLPKTGSAPRDLSKLQITGIRTEQTIKPGTGEKQIFPEAPLTLQQKEALSKSLSKQPIKEPIGSRLLTKASGAIIPNDYSIYSGKVDPLFISDIVNLLPIGFGGAATKEAITVGTATAEKIALTGTKDISTAISKPVKEIIKEPEFIRNFNRDVEGIGTKTATRVQQAKSDRIVAASLTKERQMKTAATINLGRGPGKVISKGDKGTSTTVTKPSSPSTGESFKEVQVGKGTKQLIRTKQETEQKTETQIKQEQIQNTIQKQKEEIKTPKETITKVITKPPVTQPKQKGKPVPVIPLFKPIEKTKQKPKEESVGITDVLIISKTPGTTPPPTRTKPPIGTPPPPKGKPPPTRTPPPIEPPKRPPIPPGLNKLISPSGRDKSLGNKRSFIGNVPTSDIVGMFKGEEVSYSTKTIKAREAYKTTREKKVRIL